jgi:hypothetical protein
VIVLHRTVLLRTGHKVIDRVQTGDRRVAAGRVLPHPAIRREASRGLDLDLDLGPAATPAFRRGLLSRIARRVSVLRTTGTSVSRTPAASLSMAAAAFRVGGRVVARAVGRVEARKDILEGLRGRGHGQNTHTHAAARGHPGCL